MLDTLIFNFNASQHAFNVYRVETLNKIEGNREELTD